MARHIDPNGLPSRLENLVLRLGKANVARLLAEIGHEIPASRAIHYGKAWLHYESNRKNLQPYNWTIERIITKGKSRLVLALLNSLCRYKRIRRLGGGYYGPPLPKLHQPNEQPK